MYKHTLPCACFNKCKCTKIYTGCVHINRNKNTGGIFQVGVSYMFTQMLYMMYFMLSLSFTSLGETATLFQSLSHVLSFPLGDIMTRDLWFKKLQLAVSFLFFLSPHFFRPHRFWFYTFVGHTCMKHEVQLLFTLKEGHPSGGLIPLFFL